MKSLLGRTFIASDLSCATAQLQNGHAGCDFVTSSGDLLSRHGIYGLGASGFTEHPPDFTVDRFPDLFTRIRPAG